MKDIIVYTTSTWPHCVTAKEFLRNKGYKYVEKNVQTSDEARNELIALGARGVPTFKIGNEVVVGLDTARIESLIDYTVESCPKCSKRVRVPKGKGKLQISCKECGEKYIVVTR